jgi:hypothetical protein
MLYPMLFHNLRFGVTMGPIRMNASNPMIDLIFQGSIATDGSEENIVVCHDDVTGAFSVSPKTPITMAQFVHDDFSSFRQGRRATRQTKKTFRLRRIDTTERV